MRRNGFDGQRISAWKVNCELFFITKLSLLTFLFFDSLFHTSWTPTKEHLNRLRNEVAQLEKQRETHRRDLEGMMEKLLVLWDYLGDLVTAANRTQIRDAAQECKQSSVDAVSSELKRCKKLKQDNIKKFIDEIRVKLVAQWDKIHKSQIERDRFVYFYSQTYTEDLFELHKMELDESERFYEENR